MRSKIPKEGAKDMEDIVCDLHVHSRYAMATSKSLDLEHNEVWARRKGINVIGTGDFTHPDWFRELSEKLEEDKNHPGLYFLKGQGLLGGDKKVHFMLTVETSHMYYQDNVYRRIHLITLAPSLESVAKIRDKLISHGVDLAADGRPSMEISLPRYMDLILSICEDCMVIPAHIWTPWYGVLGSKSGFRSLRKAFGGFYDFIYAIETGLSTDPLMNWPVGDVDGRAIVSFSDAHSPQKLGRELTVVHSKLSYEGITQAIKKASGRFDETDSDILYTIEYFPQEGKYYFDGHRKCGVSHEPRSSTICPVCGKELTLGVAHRIKELSGWVDENRLFYSKVNRDGLSWILPKTPGRKPYLRLIPLLEILSDVYGVGLQTKTVLTKYVQLVADFESELNLLLHVPISEIESLADERLAQAISRVRSGDVTIIPGFDGEFGKISIFNKEDKESSSAQQNLFE